MSRIRKAIVQYQPRMSASTPAGAPDLPAIVMGELDGALKEFVDYVVETASSPQPVLALGAAICAVGAAAGRRFESPTYLRTNFHVLLLSGSGSGKELPRATLTQALAKAGLQRYLGGSKIASSAGLITALRDHPVVVYSIDEIGHAFGIAAGKGAGAHKQEILPLLTELWTRASTSYEGVNYGDSTALPRAAIEQPHLVLLGAATPGTFWKAFQNGALSDGTLARFLILASPCEYPDKRHAPPRYPIPESLLNKLRIMSGTDAENGLAGHVPMTSTAAANVQTVPFDAAAMVLLEEISNDETSRKRAHAGNEGVVAFWARFTEHAVKLAMVKAISRDPRQPVVTFADLRWAEALARHCLQYALDQAADNISDSTHQSDVNKMRAFIRNLGRPVTKSELTRKFQSVKPADRTSAIETLKESGEITETPTSAGAGKATMLYAITDLGMRRR